MLNRSAIIVRAKQPFLDWLRSLPDPVSSDTTIGGINEDPTVYLLPPYEIDDAKEEILTQYCEDIFASMLDAWWTLKSDWPRKRDLAVFKRWFDVEFHSIIEDLVDSDLRVED